MRSKSRLDAFSRGGSGLVLPNADHIPSEPSEGCIRLGVAAPIRGDLVTPPSSVCFRLNAVVRTPVPEAAIDEDRNLGGGENDVGAPLRESRNRVIDAEAQSATMKRGAEAQFGC